MKNTFKVLGIIAIAAILVSSFAACGDAGNSGGNVTNEKAVYTSVDAEGNVYELTITPKSNKAAYEPKAGDTYTLKISFVDGTTKTSVGTVTHEVKNGSTVTATLSVSDSSFTVTLSTVTDGLSVMTEIKGTIPITDDDNKPTIEIELALTPQVEKESDAVIGVVLNKTALSLALDAGGSETLVATVLPTNAKNKNVTWSSSDDAVAQVSQSGLVTAVAVGSATITVITEEGGKDAICNVKVTESVETQTPVVSDFIISGLGTFTADGKPKAVTIQPKAGKSPGAVTVLYNESAAAPSAAGTYAITFNVAAVYGWNSASGLSAGTLVINKDNSQNWPIDSANYAVSQMRTGWVMGNTYDGSSANPTAWGNTVVTKAGFQYLKDAGFGVVRLPVSWNSSIAAADRANGNAYVEGNYSYAINPQAFTGNGGTNPGLLNVVQDALDAGLYVILNTHHDTGLFRLWDNNPTNATGTRTGPNINQSMDALEKVWRQIAERFRDYPDKLIFEDLSEPRNSGADEWNGGIAEYHLNLNKMHQKFVDTVRATGGNNRTRFLLVPTYAASGTQIAQKALVLPSDPSNSVNKIIVSLHIYEPYAFALNSNINNAEGYTTYWAEDGDTTATGAGPGYDAGGKPFNGPGILKECFKWAYDYFISEGYPVIIGETCAINKYRNNDPPWGFNTDSRVRWTEFYWKHAKSYGIPVFWYDNGNVYQDRNNPALGLGVSTGSNGEQGGAIFDRVRLSFPQEQQLIVDAIMRATTK